MGHCNILARVEEGRKASGKKTSGVEREWETGVWRQGWSHKEWILGESEGGPKCGISYLGRQTQEELRYNNVKETAPLGRPYEPAPVTAQ